VALALLAPGPLAQGVLFVVEQSLASPELLRALQALCLVLRQLLVEEQD
jgi:hypothetical protein